MKKPTNENMSINTAHQRKQDFCQFDTETTGNDVRDVITSDNVEAEGVEGEVEYFN